MAQPMQQEQAPAPASDDALASAPECIIDGKWDDAEWRAVAAKPSGERTDQEQYIFAGGPRPHPWGRMAFMGKTAGGADAAFPSKAAYEEYKASGGEQAERDAASAQGTLDALARGLADGGTVPPASDPAQADRMLEAASPNGNVVR